MISRVACLLCAQVPACFFELFDTNSGAVCCIIVPVSTDRVARWSAKVPGEFTLQT